MLYGCIAIQNCTLPDIVVGDVDAALTLQCANQSINIRCALISTDLTNDGSHVSEISGYCECTGNTAGRGFASTHRDRASNIAIFYCTT